MTRSGLVATALELLLIAALTRLLRVQDPAAASVDARSSAPHGRRMSAFALAEYLESASEGMWVHRDWKREMAAEFTP